MEGSRAICCGFAMFCDLISDLLLLLLFLVLEWYPLTGLVRYFGIKSCMIAEI